VRLEYEGGSLDESMARVDEVIKIKGYPLVLEKNKKSQTNYFKN
jgi:hypothetical protein